MLQDFLHALTQSPDLATLSAFEDWLKDNDGWTHDRLSSLVLTNKREDWPRSLFAHWCAENDQPERSRFIEVQLALSRIKPPRVLRVARTEQRYAPDQLLVPTTEASLINDRPPLMVGSMYDLEWLTSRVSADRVRDVYYAGVVGGREWGDAHYFLFRKGEPWQGRPRYDALLREQFQLMVAKGEYAWFDWVYIQGVSEDGHLRTKSKDGGLTAQPAPWDQYPDVVVPTDSPGLFRQRFRRGFVAEVECRLQAWLDLGPEIVRKHPIERVAIQDKVPSNNRWVREGPGHPHIPRAVFARLTRGEHLPEWEDAVRQYHSREKAMDDLSDACIEFAEAAR